jgi:hypothetical protein
MSITGYWDAWCDAEGCAEWTPGGNTRSDAAREARRAGWKFTKETGWRCPAHQETPTSKVAALTEKPR